MELPASTVLTSSIKVNKCLQNVPQSVMAKHRYGHYYVLVCSQHQLLRCELSYVARCTVSTQQDQYDTVESHSCVGTDSEIFGKKTF